MKKKYFLILLYVLFFPIFLNAQDLYLEDEDSSLWEEDGFIEELESEGSNGEDIIPELNSNTSGEYISEEEMVNDIARRNTFQSDERSLEGALNESKQLLSQNLAYGAGTGILIGGWFALVQSGDGRDNLRYIGTGVVLGTLLGFLIGTKSVYIDPNAQTVIPSYPIENQYSSINSLDFPKQNFLDKKKPIFSARFNWKF